MMNDGSTAAAAGRPAREREARMLTHVDENDRARMVDVGDKDVTRRSAHARAHVTLPAAVRDAMRGDDLHGPKGPVFATARLAGVMAMKRTADLIPLCHPLALEDGRVDIALDDDGRVRIDAVAALHGKTGVEMEALTGASIAALTIYDMCKALSHEIVIEDVRLIAKEGGRRDVGT